MLQIKNSKINIVMLYPLIVHRAAVGKLFSESIIASKYRFLLVVLSAGFLNVLIKVYMPIIKRQRQLISVAIFFVSIFERKLPKNKAMLVIMTVTQLTIIFSLKESFLLYDRHISKLSMFAAIDTNMADIISDTLSSLIY